ncbi:MPN domain-containing protein [Ralstonia mannitolilytica]|uniref:JAB domain-containing protein n=1 Tax=Ralstonia mannitolilytica TaxID=105219 RepID=UPI0039B6A022
MAAQALTADHLHPSVFSTEESSIIKAALNLIEEKRLRRKELLYYFEDFQRYLMLRFAGLTNEQGHVLYLNINRELLAAETEFFGHQSSVQWDMRKVVLRAITLGAEHVVFAHNHPNDNPQPSEADLRHLDWSIKTLQPLNINLLDSYVVTARGITSIKDVKKRQEEARWAERRAEDERRSAERRAKIAATKARKAAERAAQAEMGA